MDCNRGGSFSSYPVAYDIPGKTALSVARVLLVHVIPTHTRSRVMVSDNGTKFVNGVMSLVMKSIKIHPIQTSPYHSQGNGKVERFQRYMSDVLGLMTPLYTPHSF